MKFITLQQPTEHFPQRKGTHCLGIAVAVRCSHCIVAHVGAALQAGATKEE